MVMSSDHCGLIAVFCHGAFAGGCVSFPCTSTYDLSSSSRQSLIFITLQAVLQWLGLKPITWIHEENCHCFCSRPATFVPLPGFRFLILVGTRCSIGPKCRVLGCSYRSSSVDFWTHFHCSSFQDEQGVLLFQQNEVNIDQTLLLHLL